MLAAVALLAGGAADGLVPYRRDGDAIAASLTGRAGDAARGQALVGARQVSTCLLCHAAPLPNAGSDGPFASTIGPPLAGVGARLTPGQIRLRLVDASAVNPETVMPSFYAIAGLTRVGRPWQGRPVLDAVQIEDIVAYLSTLQTP